MKAPPSRSDLDDRWEKVFVSPELYLRSFDIAADSMTFTPMSVESYRSTSFLDARIQRAQPMDAKVAMRAFIASFDNVRPEPKPLGFIFHTAFCCSTLLSRCLQELGNTLVLREPEPLRALSEGWFNSVESRELRKMREILGVMLSRRFGDEAVVVKATSQCNAIMPELLDMHVGTRAVFLYSDLGESIASFLKNPERRREAREFLISMRHVLPWDLSLEDCQRLIDASVVALLWVLQVGRYCELASGRYGDRLIALNCNNLLRDPAGILSRVAKHLEIEAAPSEIEAAVSGSAFTLHAKERDATFGLDDRRADMRRLHETNDAEIRFASAWVKTLPLWESIPNPLPSELEVAPGAENVL